MRLKTLMMQGGMLLFMLACASSQTLAQNPINNPVSKVWVADNGDGTYKNPIIHADYSDPDVIRVGPGTVEAPVQIV